MDVTKLPDIPASVSEKAQTITVQTVFIDVEVEGKTLKIFSQQTTPGTPAKLSVLLLHGQAFTSNNWVEIKTLQLLAAMGYSAVAVDLPGYGKSKEVSVSSREAFMVALVKSLHFPKPPVIVSPSMSGSFSLPYLFSSPEPGVTVIRATAFIPVAPVSSGTFLKNYSQNQLPTLIVYGEKDEDLGQDSLNNLKHLPKSTVALIPDAGHACYLNQPVLFHKALQQFLDDVSKH